MALKKSTVWGALLLSVVVGRAEPLAFEVASVKTSPGGTPGRIQFLRGGTFAANNVPLAYLIQELFGVRDYQIAGDPRWMAVIADGTNARYDILAKGGEKASDSQVREMGRGLLAERFGFRYHKETRQLRVYALVRLPGKPLRLTPAAGDGTGRRVGVNFLMDGWIEGSGVTLPSLARALAELVDRPVVDKTELAGTFNFKLTFSPDSATTADAGTASPGGCPAAFAAFEERRGLKSQAASCPSIVTAVQDQAGLKLEARTDGVEVLVIDRVERPSAN
jgi:uncharacterized protein (TIGR03435 family)